MNRKISLIFCLVVTSSLLFSQTKQKEDFIPAEARGAFEDESPSAAKRAAKASGYSRIMHSLAAIIPVAGALAYTWNASALLETEQKTILDELRAKLAGSGTLGNYAMDSTETLAKYTDLKKEHFDYHRFLIDARQNAENLISSRHYNEISPIMAKIPRSFRLHLLTEALVPGQVEFLDLIKQTIQNLKSKK